MATRRALISVFYKEGIADFTQGLVNLDFDIISTGGTAQILTKAGIPIQEVSELTGFPEMLDGRVKTLHPVIHAGILAQRDKEEHMGVLDRQHIQTIDLVVCNLYPFEDTIQKPGVTIEEVIENIDIGGPTLVRAAAKNYKDVIVVTSPTQYDHVLQMLKTKTDIGLEEREQLAIDAFAHTAQYDVMISSYLRTYWTDDMLPENQSLALRKIQDMRYGENPHQIGAFYLTLPLTQEPCVATAVQLQGKELSFNNILDADCAIEAIKEFPDPTCVIIKHATPCGIASASTLLQAWTDAYATDKDSPFGGIIAFNRELPGDVAEELFQYFLEIIITPQFSDQARTVLGEKKNLRLLETPGLEQSHRKNSMTFRSVVGGFLAQERDIKEIQQQNWKVVTKKNPSSDELRAMEFAVKCVKHVKSNSVIFVKDSRTVAIGGGQTSRVDATWIATHKGKESIKDSVMASDAFFPFRDAVDVAAKAGVKAIVQPGGSIRDTEVIEAADEHGISMVFTGQRYFRH